MSEGGHCGRAEAWDVAEKAMSAARSAGVKPSDMMPLVAALGSAVYLGDAGAARRAAGAFRHADLAAASFGGGEASGDWGADWGEGAQGEPCEACSYEPCECGPLRKEPARPYEAELSRALDMAQGLAPLNAHALRVASIIREKGAPISSIRGIAERIGGPKVVASLACIWREAGGGLPPQLSHEERARILATAAAASRAYKRATGGANRAQSHYALRCAMLVELPEDSRREAIMRWLTPPAAALKKDAAVLAKLLGA